MSREQLETAHAPAPRGAYAQGVVAGDYVYTAGLGPLDPVSRAIVGDDAAEQTRQVLRNLSAILAEAGAGLGDVVKVTAHLADSERDWDAFDTAYREFFSRPYPVRTTAGSRLGEILVEIDVVAYRPQARGQ